MIWGLLLGIFFLGMALRLYNLDGDSLWLDEITTATRVQMDPSSVVTMMASGEMGAGTQVPLMYMVTHFFVVLFGSSDFIIRLQAMLFGSLSILLAYKLGEILWTRGVGLIGAFLLALNAYHIQWSQEARHYGLMTFLALLSLIFLLKALQKGQKRLWLGFAVATSLSLYNHAFAFLVLLAEVVYAVWILRHEWLPTRRKGNSLPGSCSQAPLRPGRRSLMLVLSLFLIALSYLPWLPIFWTQAARHWASSPAAEPPAGPLLSLAFLREAILTFSAGIGSGHLWVETASTGSFLLKEVPDIAVCQALAVLLFVALFLCGLVRCGTDRLMLFLPWFATPFVLLCFVSTKRFLHVRYVLYILPLYLLLIARGTIRLSRVLSRRPRAGGLDRRRLLALTVALALLLGLVSLEPLARYYSSHKEDWRGAARYLKDNLASHDIVVADGKARRPRGDDGRVIQCLSYYLESYGTPETPIVPVRPIIWRSLGRIGRSDGNVWTVLWYPDRPATWDSLDEVTVADFHDLAILRLREPSGNTLRDTLHMLRLLLDLLPPEARFDVHLALEEIYLQIGMYQRAESELSSATQVRPDSPEASHDLDDARDQLLAMSGRFEGIRHPLWRNLGDVIALLGHDIHPATAQAGATMDVTLWWQALAKMDRDYTVFLHVVDQDGRIWAQVDSQVLDEDRPTSRWSMGDVAKVQYEMVLTSDIPPSEYTVKLGMYFWETGQRLPVWDEEGRRATDDAALLATMALTE